MEKANVPSEEELDQLLKDKWTNKFRQGYITVKGCTLPQHYLEFQKEIDDFEVFDSDIWMCSFPRTGTTWMSEMVWLIANDFNYEKAKVTMFERVRFLEFKLVKNDRRNPLDACVSFYYHVASGAFSGNLEDFCKLFLYNKVTYGPFWKHVLPFWRMNNQDNVLFLKYEDMKQDLAKVVLKTSIFLRKSTSDAQMQVLLNHLSFKCMQKNPAVSGGKILDIVKQSGSIKSSFIRAGIVGGYKTEMPENLIEIFESWMQNNLEETAPV
ncbi:Sulfotransfer 1 domain containing protein [Asbolus verrucosus]|uniref:Sulfotransfer 1 domain containing protein n=1 Tax=Asbolus verrucosus TaxID=1661398 RepID=A0A482VBF9_ASBVE|nr:Sulfotransfer 1 domain containing protein [Asbolus verrucosus]